ncbi:hypothetical protein AgCh_038070 [Apium graveolens]
MERLIRAAEGPSLSREFDKLLKALKASLNDNHFTYKKALDRTINSIRVILVTKGNFKERRIVNTAITRIVVHENQATPIVINCTIKGQQVEILEDDVNKALGIPTDKLVEAPTQDELCEFMEFINYSERINLVNMNKKYLRREWSFLFDSVIKAFTCRKSGFDNISSVVQKLVYSMALNKHINAHPQEPSYVELVPSKPVEARKPTTPSSQKDEVSKKKRKGVTLTVITESGEDQHETESPLVKRSKKSKKTELTTQVTSVSSQQGAFVKIGTKQTLDTSSQQGVSIEKSIHPNAPCTESAQPAPEAIQV